MSAPFAKKEGAMLKHRQAALSARVGVVLLAALLAQGMAQVTPLADYQKREAAASEVIKKRLAALRLEIQQKGRTFKVGYTTAMDFKIEQLTGAKALVSVSDLARKQVGVSDKLTALDREARETFIKANPKIVLPELRLKCFASLAQWDWRKSGKVTGVRNQNPCGSCWDFAAIGAFEASFLIRNNQAIDSSEQCILNCSGAGGCGGGWYFGVMDYLISTGTATEAAYPYTANDKACVNKPKPYRAVSWGPVHPESAIPTVDQIKEALCEHGPLAIGVLVDDAFQAYTHDVFNVPAPSLTVTGADGKLYYNVNHCVTLIGWDDSKHAWLIKNSWGTGWGDTCGYGTERGYIWIDYGSSNVGLLPAWVIAKSNHYFVEINKYKMYYPKMEPFPPISIDKNIRNIERQTPIK